MDDKRMFSQLMEEQPDKNAEPTRPATPQPDLEPNAPVGELSLPSELEDLGEVGYTSHSYRLTETELRWLRRFCLRMSEHMDQTVSHNTVIRLLLRVADEEWNASPKANRLLKLLSQLKN